MIDTPPIARDTPRRWFGAAWLLGLLALPSLAGAQPRELNATVIWVRGERVYLAAPDSGTLAPSGLLTFVYRGRTIATGRVIRMLDRDLALAALTSGSLARAQQPGRLRVLGEPPPARALPLLRVGYPARGRSSLLFACDEVTLDPSRLPRGFRTDQAAGRSFRLVRGPESSSSVPWPDTLLLRLFDEPADEEIALERGELDAAVFWPGELSPRMRADARWQEPLLGLRTRGALVAIAPGSEAPGDSSATAFDSLAFAALNRELFRGDLAPVPHGPEAPPGGWRPAAARFAVDPSCPGQRVLERFLNRGVQPPPGPGALAMRVFYLDAEIAPPESLALAMAAHAKHDVTAPHADPRADAARTRVLFLIRSPLVCGPALRPLLGALGPDALVNLITCRPAGRAP